MNMKKLMGLLLGFGFLIGGGTIGGFTVEKSRYERAFAATAMTANEPTGLEIKAKAAYLMDKESGTEVYAKAAFERLPIASMCKLMTLLLSFEAIDEGCFTLDDVITVSERAASMGGSQVFLEAGGAYPVRELIKSIVVCSANDSCVAMAEKIAGSELAFTEKMNARIKELGAENTLFANCTGLPKEPQYSCAHDVAKMLSALVEHEEYFTFSGIWMDEFKHPEGRHTEMTNTNRLIRFYDGCDGGKTGFTNQAGFCLAATAKRGDMRIISVVIGEENGKRRFADVSSMFDYAFANYTLKRVVDAHNPLGDEVSVSGGVKKSVAVRAARESHLFSKRGESEDVSLEFKLKSSVKAPLKAGDKVGKVFVYRNGVEIDCVDLVAVESVRQASFSDTFKDVAEGWDFR